MRDEASFIAELESAEGDELARRLTRPSAAEERDLVEYLGEPRYERMHDMALRRSARGGVGATQGNVVVIHGIMGSSLRSVGRRGDDEEVWLKALRLMSGSVARLRLEASGRAELDADWDVRPSGILQRHYGELLLSLSTGWRVRAFWYDWRKDLELAATELDAKIRSWFDERAPVHIVAHSMGGLVARAFIAKYGERWKTMRDPRNEALGGRLVMLGTPNHGSFAMPQVMTGFDSTVQKLAIVDLRHSLPELLEVLNSFVGTYQMLPSPLQVPAMAPLYEAAAWRGVKLSQAHLDRARAHHQTLRDIVDPERMVYVAGDNQPTLSGVDVERLGRPSPDGAVTEKGDGRVTHDLGLLDGVPTYYVDEDHGGLTSNAAVLRALDELLRSGQARLSTEPLQSTRSKAGDERATRARLAEEQDRDLERLRALVGRDGRRGLRSTAAVSGRDRQVEELVTREFLGSEEQRRPARPAGWQGAASIRLRVVHDKIDEWPDKHDGEEPVDAVAIGHYLHVTPQDAELALDRAISRSSGDGKAKTQGTPDTKLLLTAYTERGILRGRLGEPFFLPDPRLARDDGSLEGDRIVAVAGMGEPGRFGAPELVVVARELCWSLGRLGRRHVASVLIGAGNGNLSATEAIDAWILGVKSALTGVLEHDSTRLREITIVEADGRKVVKIDEGIRAAQRRLRRSDGLRIEYDPLDEAERKRTAAAGVLTTRRSPEETAPGGAAHADDPMPAATRVTLSLDGGVYQFGAITENASVPQRSVALDPELVDQANEELAAESVPEMQRERGIFLGRLLFPSDLRRHLTTAAPLVMLLDATTARYHWEMVGQADGGAATLPPPGAEQDREEQLDSALGLRRGLTRQLRTPYAPPPEPPPPPRRVLNVLVVADPAEDAHLPGAEEEGVEVADLFEHFNRVHAQSENSVRVVRLFGPRRATRTNVLRQLMMHSFDVLHFAGHCVYDEQDRGRSGWLFSRDERVTAKELARVDRSPSFVFSNACESGRTPDRSDEATADLAPSLAEAFFGQGVSNFVCTGWPVNDLAARRFALTLYEHLLGLTGDGTGGEQTATAAPMHRAMQMARREIAASDEGVRSWGAYQHYGNPYFRLFETLAPPDTQEAGKESRRAAPPKGRRFKRENGDGVEAPPAQAEEAKPATAP